MTQARVAESRVARECPTLLTNLERALGLEPGLADYESGGASKSRVSYGVAKRGNHCGALTTR